MQDSTRHYYVHFDSRHSQVLIVRVDPGKPWNELKRVPRVTIQPNVWHKARFELKAGHLAAYLDGKLIAEADDATYQAGVIGLRAGQGHILFDDLRVKGTRTNLEREWRLLPKSVPHDDIDVGRLTNADHVVAVRGQGYFPVLVELQGGSLAAVVRGGAPHIGIEGRLDLIRSTDSGKTWEDLSFVSADNNHNETALLALTDKHILAASRTYSRGNIDLLESHDDGRTWSEPRRVTENSQHPADLIRLASGKLLMAYGNRREPPGCAAIISDDQGQTWDYANRVMVGWTAVSGDCGYPSSVQLDDGTIVTMYYSVRLSDIEGHEFAIAVRYTEAMLVE